MTATKTAAFDGDHRSILVPDDRKRMPLGRHMTREPVKGWKVWASEDGRQLLLEAILDD